MNVITGYSLTVKQCLSGRLKRCPWPGAFTAYSEARYIHKISTALMEGGDSSLFLQDLRTVVLQCGCLIEGKDHSLPDFEPVNRLSVITRE